MGYGLGVFLLAVGLILAFAVRDAISGVDLTMVGYILVAVGVLAIVLTATTLNRSRGVSSVTTTTHADGSQTTSERHNQIDPPAWGLGRPPGCTLSVSGDRAWCEDETVTQRLVFDGDCGFCTTSANWLAKHGRVQVVPWQRLDFEQVGLTRDQVATSVWWLVDDRPIEHSSRAIGRSLVARGGVSGLAGQVLLVPLVRPLGDTVYRLVSRYRYRLPGGTPVCRISWALWLNVWTRTMALIGALT
jgi:predicted DCC family thiol-disulfide oxidoreductase YuxK